MNETKMLQVFYSLEPVLSTSSVASFKCLEDAAVQFISKRLHEQNIHYILLASNCICVNIVGMLQSGSM